MSMRTGKTDRKKRKAKNRRTERGNYDVIAVRSLETGMWFIRWERDTYPDRQCGQALPSGRKYAIIST